MKQLRLGLVCYGGVSLAIYMHRQTKELYKLVRGRRRTGGTIEFNFPIASWFTRTCCKLLLMVARPWMWSLMSLPARRREASMASPWPRLWLREAIWMACEMSGSRISRSSV